MERPSKRLRSSTEEELSGDGENVKGKMSQVIDDSDSEFMDFDGETDSGPMASMEELLLLLRAAIARDDLEAVEKALQSIEKIETYTEALNQQDENEYTALIHATRQASVPICRAILKRGVDMNVTTSKGYSALVFAAQRGFTDLVFELIRAGVSMICANTALIPGAHFGREHIVKLLLKYGANVNHTNAKGTTALMRAAQEGHMSVLMFLLENQADPNTANGEGMTALMLASQRGHRRIVSSLIKYGADVNMRTRQGSTALLLAAKRGREGAVIELVTNGANVFLRDERQKTAFDLAQRRGYVDLLQYLTMDAQVKMMQQALRIERSYTLVGLSSLTAHHRTSLRSDLLPSSYVSAMSLAMNLPSTVLQRVAEFIPMPPLYSRRLRYLRYRVGTASHEVVKDIMPVFDELLCELSSSVEDSCSPQSGTKTTDLLIRLNQDSAFEYRFRRWGPLPVPSELMNRLKQLGHVQATLRTFGSDGLRCSRPIAEESVRVLDALLAWSSTQQRF